jgi:hypothetical protein
MTNKTAEERIAELKPRKVKAVHIGTIYECGNCGGGILPMPLSKLLTKIKELC